MGTSKVDDVGMDASAKVGNKNWLEEVVAVGVLSLCSFEGMKDADNGSRHFRLALSLSLPRAPCLPFDGALGMERGVFLGERLMEQSSSDSFKAEIDDDSEFAMTSMRRYVFFATLISHFIDSCCLATSFLSSRICASNRWQQFFSVPHSSDGFECDDCEDSVGIRGGSVDTNAVLS